MAAQREVFEAGALFVGGGPAGLAGAIHLAKRLRDHNAAVKSGKLKGELIDTDGEFPIMLIEKSAEVGDHALSGAVFNPIVLNDLIPDWRAKGAPLKQRVCEDSLVYLTKNGWSLKSPVTPPTFHNEGNYIISLGKLAAFMAKEAEELGVNVFAGFPGAETLLEGETVVGVRTGDRGIDKHGKKKPNYEPGMDIQAKVTVFGEGARGSLTKHLIPRLGLDAGKNPQVYSTGVKELWELPAGRITGGKVTHTMGFPLEGNEFGGSFIYELDDRHLIIGMVVALDAKDPHFDPHHKLQLLKTHPMVKKKIEGGKLVAYGAATIPEGGWYSIPKLSFNGGMLVGDSAGLVNVPTLKGIHYGMMSGVLAAEAIYKGILKSDFSEATLRFYDKAVEDSFIGTDLKQWARFRQGFDMGLLPGMVNAGLLTATKGMLSIAPKKLKADYTHMGTLAQTHKGKYEAEKIKFDGVTTFNKLDDVYLSGTTHEEDQPCHLVIEDYDICNTRCTVEYGNPCQHFCPASVYEMVPNEGAAGTHLQVNFSNCVHCKTCDIRDPYQIINWVTPEGGDGPRYRNL